MPLDAAFAPSSTTAGKFTFAVGSDGDFFCDSSAVYPVLACLHAHKNEWRWSSTYGTTLSTIKNERRNLTASRFVAAGTDALSQAQLAGWISPVQAGGATAQRDPQTGRWILSMRWTTPSGAVAQKVDF